MKLTVWMIQKLCKSRCVIFSILSAGIESMELRKRRTDSLINSGEEWETNTSSRSEMPVWIVSQNSVIFSGGDSSKNCGADQQRLQISDLHFGQVPYASNLCLLEEKIQDRGMYLFTIPYGSNAMDQRSGVGWFSGFNNFVINQRNFKCPILKYSMRGFLQPWTKSSIILKFKRRISREGTKGPESKTVSFEVDSLPTWSTNNSGSQESTILSTIMPTYSLLIFEMIIFRNSIPSGTQFLLSMTKIPHDDILEGLYNFRLRECEKPKTVLELSDLETHHDKIGPDYHRLKAMVKRSIEQEIRNKNFGARSGKFWEETPWSRIRGQNSVYKEFLAIVGSGKPTGNVWKETIAVSVTISISVKKWHSRIRLRILSCSRVSENHREPRSPRGRSPSGRTSRWPCKDYLRGTCNNSFCEKMASLQNACSTKTRMVAVLEKSAHTHIVWLMNSRQKRSKKNVDKSAVAMLKKGNWQERESVSDACHDRSGKPDKRSDNKLGQKSSQRWPSDARQLGCVFQDMTPPKSILRKSTDMPKPIQRVKFTKAIARHTKIRDQNPSLGYICPGEPHERSPNAPKFEDRSQEETEWQEHGAREAAWKLANRVAAWKLANRVFKLKEHQRATFISSPEKRCLLASTLKPEEDMEPPKSSSIFRKSWIIRKAIWCVLFTNAFVHHANIWDQKPKSWGSVSRGDRVARARCPRSSVEAAGQKCV